MTDLFLTTRRVSNYRRVALPVNSAFAVELGTQSFFDIRCRYALLFQITLATTLCVVCQTGTSRNQATNDNVLFQAAEVIPLAGDGAFGQNPRGFLERCR